MSDTLPGNGFWGWLGRQIGHVKQAVKTKVQPPAPAQLPQASSPQQQASPPPEQTAAAPGPQPSAQAQQAPGPNPDASQQAHTVVYRDTKIEEIPMPDRPGVLLRRTIIDEAIVDPNAPKDDASP